ncbi:SGNH/GDSL hydrolase family protein [Pseudonocardiaceae bacterium YIM PH 21723]|nr:SGNH/GDSL hydrolase family protein [Pseudonocardiaceae bacterium YIM PH 21723]
MTAQTIALAADSQPGRVVRTLVALGDSTTVGIGDPVAGGRWRGFGPILQQALGERGQVRLANLSYTGARMADVRRKQLSQALRLRPQAVVLVVGMNDTLRSDFDPVQLHDDLDAIVGELMAAGAVVVTARYHDHAKVFQLPGALRRVLRSRIDELNRITDTVTARHGSQVLDLDAMPGAYERTAWSADRLHPSEYGHRMLAQGFAEKLRAGGCAVPHEVVMECSGGVPIKPIHIVLWMIFKGIPWLFRRGSDLLPYAARIIVRDWIYGGPAPVGSHRPKLRVVRDRRR